MGAACSGERELDYDIVTEINPKPRPASLHDVVYGKHTRKSIWSTLVLVNRDEVDTVRRRKPQENDDWEGILNFEIEPEPEIQESRFCRLPPSDEELAEMQARAQARALPPGYEGVHPDLWIDSAYDSKNALGTKSAIYVPPPEKHREFIRKRALKRIEYYQKKKAAAAAGDTSTEVPTTHEGAAETGETNKSVHVAVEGQKRSDFEPRAKLEADTEAESDFASDSDWGGQSMGSPDDVDGLGADEDDDKMNYKSGTSSYSAAASKANADASKSTTSGTSSASAPGGRSSQTVEVSRSEPGAKPATSGVGKTGATTTQSGGQSTGQSALGSLASGRSGARAKRSDKPDLPGPQEFLDANGRPMSPRSRMRIMLACLNGMTKEQAFEYNAICRRNEEAQAQARKAAFARQLGITVEELNRIVEHDATESQQEDAAKGQAESPSNESSKANASKDEAKPTTDASNAENEAKDDEEAARLKAERKAAALERRAQAKAEKEAQKAEKEAQKAEKEARKALKEEAKKQKALQKALAKLSAPATTIEGVRLIDQYDFIWWEERLLQDPAKHKWKLYDTNPGVSRVYTATLNDSTVRNDFVSMNKSIKIYRAEVFIPDATPLNCFRNMYDVTERMTWDVEYKENLVTKTFPGYPFHNDLWYCYYDSVKAYEFLMVRAYSMYRDAGTWVRHRVAGTNVPDDEIDKVYTHPELSAYDYTDPTAAGRLPPELVDELSKQPEALSYIYRSVDHPSKPATKKRALSQGMCMFVKTPLPPGTGFDDQLSMGREGTLFLTISATDLDMNAMVRMLVESQGPGQFQKWCEKFINVMRERETSRPR